MNLFNLNCITQSVAVTSTATRIRIDNDDGTIRLVNTGTATVFVAIGNDTVVATVPGAIPARTGLALLAGSVEHFARTSIESRRFLSFVTAGAGTATVILSTGYGE